MDYEENSIRYRFVGSRTTGYAMSTFSYAAGAMGYIRRHACDADIVVEDFAPYNPVFSRWLAGKTPVAIQVHHREGRELFNRYNVLGLPFMLCEAWYPKRFASAIAVSQQSRAKYGIPHATVIPNGIDASLLDEPSGDEGYICFMGRLHEHNKGLDTLFDALSRSSGARLVIAGRGPDEERLKDKAWRMGIEDRVEFRGFVGEAEKRSLIADASLFMLPSRYEGQGIVVLEAAALGTPVIVSGIPELGYAVEGGFGEAFPTGNPAKLANLIGLLLEKPARREEMARRGREYAARFTWDIVAEQYERFLLGVAEGGAR
jgi:glycosyltransferase involved in cell wall biosynthesis